MNIEQASQKADLIAVREVVLTLINNREFYDSVKPVIENLAKKMAHKKYVHEQAPKAYENAVKAFLTTKEWATVYGTWRPSVADRMVASVDIRDYYHEQVYEQAAELIGPEYVSVRVSSFDNDSCGNPNAQHVVFTSTEDGGCVKKLTSSWTPRRDQVGYGDYTDGCLSAMSKVGLWLGWYTRVSTKGSRSEGEIVVLYKRNDI